MFKRSFVHLDSNHPTDQTLRAYGVGKLYGTLAKSVHSHAPEQSLDAQKADIRADIYSLGVRSITT